MSSNDVAFVSKTLHNVCVDVYRLIRASDVGNIDVRDRDRKGLSESGTYDEIIDASGAGRNKRRVLECTLDSQISETLRDNELLAKYHSNLSDKEISLSGSGKYSIAFSFGSNTEKHMTSGLPITFSFGVFYAQSLEDVGCGEEIVIAGYAICSASLQLVLCSRNKRVSISQYCTISETWTTLDKDHQRPNKGYTYAADEGWSGTWSKTISAYVSQHLRGHSVRWTGNMVLDIHHHLLFGGCFLKPSNECTRTSRREALYEAIPLAYVWECAGNGVAYAAENGTRILEIPFFGNGTECFDVFLLGDAEAKALKKIQGHASLWAGGNIQEKIKVKQTEQENLIRQEVSLLRTALVVGAVINILLLIRAMQ